MEVKHASHFQSGLPLIVRAMYFSSPFDLQWASFFTISLSDPISMPVYLGVLTIDRLWNEQETGPSEIDLYEDDESMSISQHDKCTNRSRD